MTNQDTTSSAPKTQLPTHTGGRGLAERGAPGSVNAERVKKMLAEKAGLSLDDIGFVDLRPFGGHPSRLVIIVAKATKALDALYPDREDDYILDELLNANVQVELPWGAKRGQRRQDRASAAAALKRAMRGAYLHALRGAEDSAKRVIEVPLGTREGNPLATIVESALARMHTVVSNSGRPARPFHYDVKYVGWSPEEVEAAASAEETE